MRYKKIGQRVKILGGLREFHGQTGTIIDIDRTNGMSNPPMYRVKLDEPVEVEFVGVVEDDLWEGQYLRNIRS